MTKIPKARTKMYCSAWIGREPVKSLLVNDTSLKNSYLKIMVLVNSGDNLLICLRLQGTASSALLNSVLHYGIGILS